MLSPFLMSERENMEFCVETGMWISGEKQKKIHGRNPHILRIFLKFGLDEGR